MQYTITINQLAVMELNAREGLDIDLKDAALLDFIVKFSGSDRVQKVHYEGETYFWLSHNLIKEQLPLLALQKDSIYRRMKTLASWGLLEQHPNSGALGRSYYRVTERGHRLNFAHLTKSEGSDENPRGGGLFSEAPSDENPMYHNTRDKGTKNSSSFTDESLAQKGILELWERYHRALVGIAPSEAGGRRAQAAKRGASYLLDAADELRTQHGDLYPANPAETWEMEVRGMNLALDLSKPWGRAFRQNQRAIDAVYFLARCLSGLDKVDAFYQKNVTLSFIISNLGNIVKQIRHDREESSDDLARGAASHL